MKYVVMSKSQAIRYTYEPHEDRSIIISISDSTDYTTKLLTTKENNIKSILYLHFDDIDNINGYEVKKDEGFVVDIYNCCYDLISDEDAEKIVNFVNRHKDSVDAIIVHCRAGISRSSGVCAAIMKYLEGNDSAIFNNPKYHPNMRCYKTVLTKFYEKTE